VVISLERGADCLRMVQLMPLHPKTPLSLASFKSKLVVPLWYRLTQVVLEKRPLNGCSSSSSSRLLVSHCFIHTAHSDVVLRGGGRSLRSMTALFFYLV